MYEKVGGKRKGWMEKWIREEVGRRRCSADEANGYSQHRRLQAGQQRVGRGKKNTTKAERQEKAAERRRGGWQER